MHNEIRRRGIARSKQKALLAARQHFPRSLVGSPARGISTHDELEDLRRRYVMHHYQNRTSCSCHMCRNARHSAYSKGDGRLSLQERVAQQRWREDAGVVV